MFFALFAGSAMMIASLAISILLFGAAVRMLGWLNDTKLLGYDRFPLVFDLGIASLLVDVSDFPTRSRRS